MIGKARERMGMRTWSYAEVEAALAKIFDAEDVQRTAFRGRIQHFRKCGLPARQPGKGARIRYSAADIFELMLAFEFAEFGLDPRLAIQVIRRHWRLKIGLWDAVDYAQKFPGDDFHVAIETHIMSWHWNKEKFKRTDTELSYSAVAEPIWVRYFKTSDNQAFLDELKAGGRFWIFNLSARVRAVEQALKSGGE
jgi:hypothetical protein